MLTRTIIATLALLGVSATSSLAAGFPGFPPCPANAKNDFALITYATDFGSPDCATIVSCTNLDKVQRSFVCQFFAFTGSQAGVDATLTLDPGRAGECATRNSDPVDGIRVVNASASASVFEGNGRICSDTKKLACHATLSCETASGPVVQTINLVVKKQKGD